MVRLTVRVELPPYDQFFVTFFGVWKKQVFFGPKSLFSGSNFSNLRTVRALGADPPPPLIVSLTVKYPFFDAFP